MAALGGGLTVAAIPPLAALLTSSDDATALLGMAIACIITLALYLLTSWALVRGIDRRRWRDLGLRFDARALVGLLLGVAISVGVGLVVQLLARAMGIGRELGDELVGEIASVPIWVVVVFVLLQAFVLQGVGEEVLFRGYLLSSLSGRPVLAVLVAAVAFAVPHLISQGGQRSAIEHVVYLVVPFGFAISAGFLAVAMGSVWAAIGIHGGVHLGTASLAAAGLIADGPVVWMLLGAGHAVAGTVIALRIRPDRWSEVAAHGPYTR